MNDPLDFLAGGGEAARLIRARDWSGHPMGPPEQWPEPFRTALSLVLNSPESMILAWGPELSFFFNDTYIPLLGPRVDWAMGARFDRVWADAWEQARPIVEDAMAARPRRFVDLPWKLGDDRGATDTWWSFSYSRVLGADGAPAGLFIFTNETTDRVVSETRRHEAEARLRRAQEAGGVGVFSLELGEETMFASAEFCRIYGLEPCEQVRVADVLALVDPEDLPSTSLMELRSQGRVTPQVEYRVRHAASGEVRVVSRRAEVERDAEGRPVRLVGVVQDVTERRRARRALEASEARFRAFAEAAPNHVWSATPDGRVDWANGRAHAYSGQGDEELRSAGWAAYVHPDDLPRVGEEWARSLATGDDYETEFRLRRADGAYRWHLARAVALRDGDSAITGWLGSNTDIDDQKSAAEALRRLNEELEERVAERTRERDRMWRLSRDLFLIVGRDGVCQAANPAWASAFGYDPDTLPGRRFNSFVHPDDRETVRAGFRKALVAEGAVELACRVRRGDGEYRETVWVAVAAGSGVYCTGRDVTDQRRTEEALRQAQKMEAVGQLTGGLAHDFNNLLAGVSGALELIGIRIAQGRVGEVERYVSVAQGATRRAAALTHRLLAFSRRQTLDPRPTDANALAAGMEELIRRTVGPAVRVRVVQAAGLWPTLVDPPQLENALLNLCINARDAMPDGGVITVETANRRIDEHAARAHDLPPGEYISLCVSDTGTGMTPEVAAKAFDPFFTTKPMGEGTGLGLSMIYGFAKQSGGQVRIYSEVGQGTTLCIYLPRHLGDAPPVDLAAAPVEPPGAGAGETVLVVDDEPTVRLLVTEVLKDLGYVALEEADSAAGLRVLESGVRIDLLVTDVGLPGGMNGRQMADAARARRPDLKVLFITGYAENAVFDGGRLEPGTAVLTKPFVVEALGARVREMIARAPA